MTRHLGLGHREAHPAEEAASTPLANVAFGAVVGLSPRDADGVEPEPPAQPLHL